MSLSAFNTQIDDIDNRILDLLERRKLIVGMINKIEKKQKTQTNKDELENQIIFRLHKRSRKLKPFEIDNIYRTIFNLGKKISKKNVVNTVENNVTLSELGASS